MEVSRFAKMSPPRLRTSRPKNPTNQVEQPGVQDLVTISEAAKELPKKRSWMKSAGLAMASLAALSAISSPAAQASEIPSSQQNFQVVETLVYGKGEQAPCGDSIDLLQEYSQTEFGAPIIAEIAQDALQAVEDGFLTPDGEVTIDGQFEGFEPFRISCGAGAQGGPNGITLPARYPEHFRHSGQDIHPLAIVHHEIGHTKYGMPAQSSDIVTDQHGSRYHVEHELEIVKRFENPVREEYGYAPRTSYTNHLGETATLHQH